MDTTIQPQDPSLDVLALAETPCAPPPAPLPVHVMLDLETMGKRPGCVVAAIGAVKFTAEGILSEFYARIDLRDCASHGLKWDGDTVLWWLKQSDAARAELQSGERLIQELCRLNRWFDDCRDACVWGNGSDFDNVILTAAFEAVQLIRPWGAFKDRCYRTVKKLAPEVPLPPLPEGQIAHKAVDDARRQALHLIEILRPSGALRIEDRR